MQIKISNLSDDCYDYIFEGNIEEIELSEPYFGNFETSVKLAKYQDQIILNSETSINTKLVCDRCSEEFEKKIKSQYKIVYLLRGNVEDNESIDVIFLKPETDKIDIKDDVRDYALLALPMKNLCSENCKGLCYKCGRNLNESECNCEKSKIDERWKPLLKLKNNK